MIHLVVSSDYDDTVVMVHFAANQSVSCVQIDNVVDDNNPEFEESFFLVIRPAPNSGLVPGGNATVTIEDDGATIATSGEKNSSCH